MTRAVNKIMRPVTDFFINYDKYHDLDVKNAVTCLSRALQCKTISALNLNHENNLINLEFKKLHEIIKSGFPNLMKNAEFEVIGGNALLITIKGALSEQNQRTEQNNQEEEKEEKGIKALRPCLFMSHQDVVPVVAGTEKDWTHDAFSGFVDEKYIWGRGALDIKQMVFGILEACEYLLAHGFKFKRTVYLAFGDDEETFNTGAARIAEVLKSRGVELEFVLDEGGGVIESGADFGAESIFISKINLMEKGYADLELSVESAGGHSSRPFGGTSLEHIARAVTAICDAEFDVKMPSVLIKSLEILRPYIIKEPLKSLVQDMEGNLNKIAEYCLNTPELFPYVVTTVAPTMIEGGSAACNVMPQNMRAVINFRLNEGDTFDKLMSRAESAIKNIKNNNIKLKFLQANNPSKTARSDGYGYKMLVESLNKFYKDVIFIPSLTVGATDAHCYENICDTCLRCSPFMSDLDDARTGVHGTDERLLIKSYAHGIRVLIDLISKTC